MPLKALVAVVALVVLALLVFMTEQPEPDRQSLVEQPDVADAAAMVGAEDKATGDRLVAPVETTDGISREEQARETLAKEKARSPNGTLQP